MCWLTMFFKGSGHKISKGRYHGKYEGDTIWKGPSTSADAWSDSDNKETDCAIALSQAKEEQRVISNEHYQKTCEEEEDQKGKEIIEDESHLKDDEQLAKALQESLNDACSDSDNKETGRAIALSQAEEEQRAIANEDHQKTREEEEDHQKSCEEEDQKIKKVIENESHLEDDEKLAKALQESLYDAWSDSDDKETGRAIAVSQAEEEQRAISNEDHQKTCEEEEDHQKSCEEVEGDEQLAKALQESLNVESPHNGICAGCKAEIGRGQYLHYMGAVWHPECFRCHACWQPVSDYEYTMYQNRPYHKNCYKKILDPRCDVCKHFISTNADGLIEARVLPFWVQKYCPSHERDGTPQCCSCKRMPVDVRYVDLGDGRKLCLECLDSAIMETQQCHPLYIEIQEFFEGLNMKVEQQVPLLLVERQALNEALEGEQNGHHHLPEIRGLCLSEDQTVPNILRRPRFENDRVIDMFTEPHRLIQKCEVTAILVLYGLPRLLTGSILAHEMMHAWLRLNGYPKLNLDVEEGICQVLAHMWLDSEIVAGSGSTVASSSSSSFSSSSSLSSTSSSSKKGERSQFENKLGEFFKHEIETDTSIAYGDGFREGNEAVRKYGLKSTLDHIWLTRCFP